MQSAALQSLMEQHHDESFRWALGCCQYDEDLASEVLQTVYLKILEGKARFEGRSQFKTWIFSVIRNTTIDFQRKRTRQLRLLKRASPTETAIEKPIQEQIFYEERAVFLRRALEHLSARQRDVLLLVFYHEMTIEEAAKALNVSLGTARTHYERGKSRLRTILESQKGEIY